MEADSSANAKGSSTTLSLRIALANCCEFMTVLARGPQTALAFHHAGVTARILERVQASSGETESGGLYLEYCPQCLLYRLAGAMSRSCIEAANRFGYGKEDKMGFWNKLFDQFKVWRCCGVTAPCPAVTLSGRWGKWGERGEGPATRRIRPDATRLDVVCAGLRVGVVCSGQTIRDEKVDNSHTSREQANGIYCLVGLLLNCERARTYCFQKEGGGSAWYYGTRLYKLAALYANAEDGMMVGAAMDGLTALTVGGADMKLYRDAMEGKEIGNEIGKKVRACRAAVRICAFGPLRLWGVKEERERERGA